MSLNPNPPAPAYDRNNESTFRDILKRWAMGVLRTDKDVELQPTTRLILTSPNGTRYALTVNNAGAWTSTAL